MSLSPSSDFGKEEVEGDVQGENQLEVLEDGRDHSEAGVISSTLTTLIGPGVGVNNSRSAGFCLKIKRHVENNLVLTRKSKELFQISLEKEKEVKGRGLPMAVLKENLEGQLKTPKVIIGIQVMVRKIP